MERRSCRVFLDSNVILSGLTSDRGAPRLILDILSLGLPGLQGAVGRYNLTEIERMIAGRIPAARDVLGEFLTKANLDIVFLPFSDELAPFRGIVDDVDLPVLVSAVISRADFFVSDDRRLMSRLGRNGRFSARPCRPDEFLNDVLTKFLGADHFEGGQP